MLPQLAGQLAAHPPGDHQASAAASLAARWAGSDPMAASQWLNAEPAGPTRDSAIRAFTASMGKDDPEAAFELR